MMHGRAARGKILEVKMPEKFRFLAMPAPYKVAWGGRGGAKSWAFARQLLVDAVQRPLRILCARETMQSIADSVHALLSDQIATLGLTGHYEIQKSGIYGRNGSQFAFAGLRHNVSQIKSYEAFDRVWVEEAQSVSNASWEVLIPTIRKEQSEIWISFNPVLQTDATYKRFILNPPPGAVVVKTNWRDNPYLSDKFMADLNHMKETDPEGYDHVYEGCCVTVVEGAIYAAELRKLEIEQRITKIAYDRSRPVHTFWDLGFSDSTAIWFAQVYPWEYRFIDYLEGSGQPLAWYQIELQRKSYVFGDHYLPHDARAKTLATGKSIQEMMLGAGFRVKIVPQLSITDGINAVRTLLSQCWFDGERCGDGLQALRRYRWTPVGASGIIKREPLHDENSHAADAFRGFAVGIKAPAGLEKPRLYIEQPVYSGAWS